MKTSPFAIHRGFTSLIFIYASGNHFLQSDKIFSKVSRTAAYHLVQNKSLFDACIMLSGMAMLVAGIALLAGYKNKLAAIVLLIMLIPITLTVQLNNFNDLGPFFKNVAIAGSLLFIINYKQNEIKNTDIIPGNATN